MTKPAPQSDLNAQNRFASADSLALAPVFIYSGYRTGSTWLWSKFRENANACAYYEPFNEMLGNLQAADIFSIRPDSWRSHHPNATAYLAEYGPLLGQQPGVALFPTGDQDGERFTGAEGIDGPLDPDIQTYCANLIASAQERGRVPVLACTRMLGRAAGFRSAFGGQHILLVRNLLHQWNSYSGQYRFGNDYFLKTLYISLQLASKNDFIRHLSSYFSDDAIDDYAVWIERSNHDRIFCYFAAFHLYFLMVARRNADLLIDVNRLARHGKSVHSHVAEEVAVRTGLTIHLADARESVDYPIQPLTSVEDCRMLLRGMVDRLLVDHAHSREDERFVEGLLADLWEEHARFLSATAGASEVIAMQAAGAEEDARRSADMEAEHAELIERSEEAAREAAARLEDQRQSLQAELDLVREAAAEVNAKLETAISEMEERERRSGEVAQQHAAMLRIAEDRVVASEQALAQANSRLTQLYNDYLSLSHHNGRLEEKRHTLEAEVDLVRTAARETNAKLEIAIREKEQRERQSDDALQQYAAMLRNADEKISASEQALARVNARLAEADARQAELATNLETVRQTAHEQMQSLHDEIARTSDLLASRDDQLQRAATLLSELPGLLAEARGPLLSFMNFFSGKSQRSAIAAHQAAIAQWQADTMSIISMSYAKGKTSLPSGDSQPSVGKFMIGGIDAMSDNNPITSVPRLLAPHDRQFIQSAYQAVLGRAPDAQGEAYYLERLRAGAHKLDILKQLRRSPEGQQFVPGVAGLDRAIKRHRIANLPLIGWLVRFITGAEGNGATQLQLRLIMNDIGCLRGELSALAGSVQQLAARPIVVAADPAPSSQPVPPPAAQKPLPPSLDTGPMPETLDSQERRLLRSLRLFALTRGAPA